MKSIIIFLLVSIILNTSHASLLYKLQSTQEKEAGEETNIVVELVEDIIETRAGKNTVIIGTEEYLANFWKIGFISGNGSIACISKLTPDMVTKETVKKFHMLHLKDNKPNLFIILA